MGLLMILSAFVIVIFCYANVFYKYNSMLLRKQKRSAHAATILSEKSKKLLFKLCVLTANFMITFLPFVVCLAVMMATEAEVPDSVSEVIFLIFEIGLFLNPILIYLLDAKMRLSVDEMFGLYKKKIVDRVNDRVDQIELKDLPATQAPQNREKTAAMSPSVLRANSLQLKSPISPADTQHFPAATDEIKTIHMTRN